MESVKHSELTLEPIAIRTFYAGDFYTEYRHNGWYATRCTTDHLTPLTASQVGPCVSEKQACYLFVRKFNR